MDADQLLNFLRNARQDVTRGDAVFRCGFNGALDVVAARVREMQAADAVTALQDGRRTDLSKTCPFCPAGPNYYCGHYAAGVTACPPADAAPLFLCTSCGRKSWDEGERDKFCDMPQPNGQRCNGRLFPSPTA